MIPNKKKRLYFHPTDCNRLYSNRTQVWKIIFLYSFRNATILQQRHLFYRLFDCFFFVGLFLTYTFPITYRKKSLHSQTQLTIVHDEHVKKQSCNHEALTIIPNYLTPSINTHTPTYNYCKAFNLVKTETGKSNGKQPITE